MHFITLLDHFLDIGTSSHMLTSYSAPFTRLRRLTTYSAPFTRLRKLTGYSAPFTRFAPCDAHHTRLTACWSSSCARNNSERARQDFLTLVKVMKASKSQAW